MSARLKIVTLNIHKGMSQFNRRVVIHELRDGLRALDPDLVFLQEAQGLNQHHALRFSGWPGEALHEFLAAERWQHAYGRNAVYAHGHHGNAILSRYPIVSVANHDVSNHRFERRGLLHCRIEVPGHAEALNCFCVHLSLHDRGRRRQLGALASHVAATGGAPAIVAGDFNDWRMRARRVFEESMGFTEVSITQGGKPARTFPSIMPLLWLDRIYVRGFRVLASRAHHGIPWSLLSDHIALSAELVPA